MKINISTAVIFCGGRGKRLKPITNNIPKPLAPVCGRPFIFYIIEQLISFKIKKVIFLTGYKSNLFKKKINTLTFLKKKIKFVFKKTPVNWETGKRLNNLKNINDKFFLLLYSDNLIYFDYFKYINTINPNKIINMIIQKKALAGELGNVKKINQHFTYSHKRKKNFTYVELGYSIVSKKIFKILNNSNSNFSLVLENLSKNKNLGCHKILNKYHSITDLKALKKSSKTILKFRKKNLKYLI